MALSTPDSVIAPIYTSTVYDVSVSDPTTDYPRSLNTPTQCLAAQKIAKLEYSDACVLSGSAAIVTALFFVNGFSFERTGFLVSRLWHRECGGQYLSDADQSDSS